MKKYLFILSKGLFDSSDTGHSYELFNQLSQLQNVENSVYLYFVQNAVLALRQKVDFPFFEIMNKNTSLKVFADDLSLIQYGIHEKQCKKNISVINMEQLLDFMMEDDRLIVWY